MECADVRELIALAPPHPATLGIDELLLACDWGRERTGGPGGQHRNKVESAVWITHLPSGVEAQASERRSATENKRVAVGRLRHALAVAVRCPVAIGEVRSALWLSRCTRAGTIACNPSHDDYPHLLAEAMDVVHSANWDVKQASLRLGCSMSQLLKFIQDHTPAFLRLNEERRARGHHALR